METRTQPRDLYGQEFKLIKVRIVRGHAVFTYRPSFPEPETYPALQFPEPFGTAQDRRRSFAKAHWVLRYHGRDVMGRGPTYEPRIALGDGPWNHLNGSRLFIKLEAGHEDAERDEGFGPGVRVADTELRKEVEKAVQGWIEEEFGDDV